MVALDNITGTAADPGAPGAVFSFRLLRILSVIGFFILGFGRSTYTTPV
jgi:hypothetical protein